MIDPTDSSNVIWWWLTAVTIPMAVLSGGRLWVIDHRERLQRLRLEVFRGAKRVEMQAAPSRWQQLGSRLAPIVGVVEQQRLLKLLAQAGLKGHGSLANFIAIKVITAIVLVALTWLVLEWRHLFIMMLFRLAALGVALLVGWRLPDTVLNRLVKRRRLRLEYGIPDALDLLVVCAEAGLSLNQSIEEISRQLRLSNKDVADEFAATSAEMRVLPDFGQALDNLVDRTGLIHLRSLVATLKQSMKFGTPLGESLRMIAGEMRAERQARIEERAARLPVLLAIPMMMFILPCLLMIIGTPVVIRIMDLFKNISFGIAP
jgi:tight adherence protein C